jgi:hypothetical protein
MSAPKGNNNNKKKLKKSVQHELKWFMDRIGKIVYRNTLHGHSKCCETCKKASEFGIFIKDKVHAEYLFTIQGDLGIDYRDNK